MIKHDPGVAKLRAEGLEKWKIHYLLADQLENGGLDDKFDLYEKLKIIAKLAIRAINMAHSRGEIKDIDSAVKDFLEYLELEKRKKNEGY